MYTKSIAPLLSIIALSLAFSLPSLANDFTAGGTPADLVPTHETRISMKSEDIIMEYKDGLWSVSAGYLFFNSSGETIKHQVGFPEIGCDPNGGYDCVTNAFKKLTTTVNGRAVTHKKGQITEAHEWSRDLGTVWLFDVAFAPNKATRIAHSYTVFTGGDLSWTYNIDYLVKTGAGWAGKIGAARFRVKLPPAAHTISPGDYKQLPTFVHEPGQRPYFLLERKNKDWTPPKSIGMSFVFTAWSDVKERLGEDRLARSGVREEDECDIPVAAETAAQMQMCKNLIYAISGYPFKSEKLRKYFYGNAFDWRLAEQSKEEKMWIRGLRPFEGFERSWIPALDRSFLRQLEQLKFDKGSVEADGPAPPKTKLSEADLRADEKLKAALAAPKKAGPKEVTPSRTAKALPDAKAPSAVAPVPPLNQQSEPPPPRPQKASGLCSIAPAHSKGSSGHLWLFLFVIGLCFARRLTSLKSG